MRELAPLQGLRPGVRAAPGGELLGTVWGYGAGLLVLLQFSERALDSSPHLSVKMKVGLQRALAPFHRKIWPLQKRRERGQRVVMGIHRQINLNFMLGPHHGQPGKMLPRGAEVLGVKCRVKQRHVDGLVLPCRGQADDLFGPHGEYSRRGLHGLALGGGLEEASPGLLCHLPRQARSLQLVLLPVDLLRLQWLLLHFSLPCR
mmetsp:Transcript_5863/g.12222  ORF Transcript_5863/g.12222 Transcript_5863/m.12222 type:complete len:203 (+) Transcript_5863:227-835(+)